jgi:hypothetical protein
MIRPLIFVVLMACSMTVGSQSPPAMPALRISIYAPRQKHAPLEVVGFHYSMGGIAWMLHNDSNKIVTAVGLVGLVDTLPLCAAAELGADRIRHNSLLNPKMLLRINPGETSATPEADPPLSPSALVMAAREAKYALLHVQAAISEVDFADGSVWHVDQPPAEANPAGLIDPALVTKEKDVCEQTNVADIQNALSQITEIGFSTDTRPEVGVAATQGSSLPHLAFSCSLNGIRATCPFE